MENNIKVELIENYIKENGLTNTQFCKHCKISYGTFLRIKRGEVGVKITALFRMARVMKIHIKDLFAK